MGKLNCPCGWQMSDVGYPCADKSWLVTDAQTDKIGNIDDFLSVARDVWECPKCGRIAIGVSPSDPRVKWYSPCP